MSYGRSRESLLLRLYLLGHIYQHALVLFPLYHAAQATAPPTIPQEVSDTVRRLASHDIHSLKRVAETGITHERLRTSGRIGLARTGA